MEGLIIVGIIVAIAIWRHLAIHGKVGEEIETGLNERIRLNEMKAEMTRQTGGEKDIKTESVINNPENRLQDALEIMEDILNELGCQPKKEGENEIQVAYQGENFIIRTDGPYAQIWDPGWARMNVNDPNFENMKVAANIANFDFGPTILYTNANDEGNVTLHTKEEIILFPSIPNRNEYIRSVFNSFFEKKENMRSKFMSLINQQQEGPKPHRPVGFATSEDEN